MIETVTLPEKDKNSKFEMAGISQDSYRRDGAQGRTSREDRTRRAVAERRGLTTERADQAQPRARTWKLGGRPVRLRRSPREQHRPPHCHGDR